MERFDNLDVIIVDVISSHGKWRRDKTAIVCGERSVTWAQFNRHCNQVAHGLAARGLKRGERVSVLSGNSIEMLEVVFGTIKAGGVIVPLSVMVQGESLARMVMDSESRFLFASAAMAPVMDPLGDRFPKVKDDGRVVLGGVLAGWTTYQDFLAGQPDHDPKVSLVYKDPINIMYSSGTTGVPKGILHSHHNRTHFALSFGLDFRVDSSAVVIVTTALYANGTWLTMLPAMFSGATLVLMTKFEPQDFFALVAEHRTTHTFMVPTQFQILLEQDNFDQQDLSSMRVWLSAGSPFRKKTKQEVLQRFPGELMELWGLTEGVATTLKPEHMSAKTESVGLPLVGWDVRIIDEKDNELPPNQSGEIVAYSAFLMPSYYKLPDKTQEAIWRSEDGKTYLKTGDMGKLDEEGFLYILDRKKDMIISGGINIFASDLEEVVSKHPAVADVAVIGVPHPKWGETPIALVIPKGGAEASEQEVLDWSNPKLAKYQRLGAVEFRDDFPRNVLGKVLKKELREEYQAKEEA